MTLDIRHGEPYRLSSEQRADPPPRDHVARSTGAPDHGDAVAGRTGRTVPHGLAHTAASRLAAGPRADRARRRCQGHSRRDPTRDTRQARNSRKATRLLKIGPGGRDSHRSGRDVPRGPGQRAAATDRIRQRPGARSPTSDPGATASRTVGRVELTPTDAFLPTAVVMQPALLVLTGGVAIHPLWAGCPIWFR